MVCRECGAYNAEHLTHCRVCAAKLRDENTADLTAGQAREEGKPQREFAKAPVWPTAAFSGSIERPAYNPPKGEVKAQEESAPQAKDEMKAPVQEPVVPAAVEEPKAAPAPVQQAAPAPQAAPKAAYVPTAPAPKAEESKRVCSVCGKPMLPDAPFCAYCGSHEGLPGAEPQTKAVKPVARPAAAPVLPAQEEKKAAVAAKPAKSAKAAARVKEDFDFDEDFDDFEDEDEAFLPKKKKGKLFGKKKDDFDFDEDDFEEDDDFDDDDDDFDDDDDYDDDRRGGKGTTILFWVLIALLVALIGVFGAYVVKKNFGGSVSNMIAAISGKEVPEDQQSANDITANPSTVVDASKMYTAEIGEDIQVETGTPVYMIDIYAPAGTSIKLETTMELVDGGVTTIGDSNHAILKVPKVAFMPNAPVDTDTIVIKPKITATSPEGETVDINVPEVTAVAEPLQITLDQPTMDVINNTLKNDPITLSGSVQDYTVSVFVNGTQIAVDAEGKFNHAYQPAGGEAAETITIEAKKNNCKTAVHTITVEPYVVQDGNITVTSNPAVEAYELRSDKDNLVTIKGTTVPGATVTGTCASDKIVFGTATVSETGEFQLPVTVNEGGVFTVTLKATAEGYKDAETKCFIERLPDDDSSDYLKACKNMKSEQHAAIAAGTITSGDYYLRGKVTEVVSGAPYEVVKMELEDGEVVYVTNRSAKARLDSDDLKKERVVAGSVAGTYEDTGLPHLWVWYMWNK